MRFRIRSRRGVQMRVVLATFFSMVYPKWFCVRMLVSYKGKLFLFKDGRLCVSSEALDLPPPSLYSVLRSIVYCCFGSVALAFENICFLLPCTYILNGLLIIMSTKDEHFYKQIRLCLYLTQVIHSYGVVLINYNNNKTINVDDICISDIVVSGTLKRTSFSEMCVSTIHVVNCKLVDYTKIKYICATCKQIATYYIQKSGRLEQEDRRLDIPSVINFQRPKNELDGGIE